jgi:hypothetical protein
LNCNEVGSAVFFTWERMADGWPFVSVYFWIVLKATPQLNFLRTGTYICRENDTFIYISWIFFVQDFNGQIWNKKSRIGAVEPSYVCFQHIHTYIELLHFKSCNIGINIVFIQKRNSSVIPFTCAGRYTYLGTLLTFFILNENVIIVYICTDSENTFQLYLYDWKSVHM